MNKVDTKVLCKIAKLAGKKILEVYNSDNFEIESKEDKSPITLADKLANEVITEELIKIYSDIPIISEETKNEEWTLRKNWKTCFIVDPIDGTKEFINKNGEFTVNIAYVEGGIVKEGVVYAPALDQLYFTQDGKAFREQNEKRIELPIYPAPEFTVAVSKSHPNQETKDYISKISSEAKDFSTKQVGSSLKFCLVAEGLVEEYPRLVSINEWDVAAAHAVVKRAGGNVLDFDSRKELNYNKEDLKSGKFIARLDFKEI